MKSAFKNLLELIIKLFSKIKPGKKEKTVEIIPEFTTQKLYVNSEIGLRVRSTPEIVKDNILDVLKYGQEISVVEKQDKWFKIRYNNNKEGWASCMHLIEHKPVSRFQITKKEEFQDTFLKFKIGVTNLAVDDNTIKLRKLINYEFGLDFNRDELQCTEYVQYKFQQMGINIQWPVRTNRNGGNWANIFESYGLYKVLNKPKPGHAICFTTGFRTAQMNKYGHVAFVEQVFDDGSIRVSEANWPRPGKYNERMVSKIEWQNKHKCRFIDFS